MKLNAVFEGGGVKGLALVGALHHMEERGVVFDATAGTSAGSIVAALYAAGYSATELKRILLDTDFQDLLDPSFPKTLSLWLRYGIHRGTKIYKWVYRMLREKGVVQFEDLKDKRELTIIASDVTHRRILRFDMRSNPTMLVAEAVRMSIGIPLFFHAYRWGQSLVVDGGLLSNYPVWVFQDTRRRTIGFKLVSSSELDVPEPPGGILGFFKFLPSILATMMDAHDKEDERNLAWVSTIHIPTGGIPTTKFGLSQEEKEFLYNSGWAAAKKFLDGPGGQFLDVTGATEADQLQVLRAAWGEIDKTFNALPGTEPQQRVGSSSTPLPGPIRERFEDADRKLVVADQLKIATDPAKMARYFVKVGLFWRSEDDYPRALARMERAIALKPDWSDVHLALGETLSYVAADTPAGSSAKAALLDRAEQSINRAVEISGEQNSTALHDLGWIRDERGDYESAAALYRKARDWDRQQGNLEEDPITYNLACALAKSGKYEEALRELQSIIGRDFNSDWAQKDPDFEGLRTSPEWGPRFADLLGEAKKR